MKPDIRIVQQQEEHINDVSVSGWEAEQLLRKYGYGESSSSTIPAQDNPVNGMTFEEMVAQEEARLEMERAKRKQQMGGPRPITFDGRDGYHSSTSYGTDDDTGFGFKIEITSDMPIPKRN
jgi:hypothetical protein